MPRVSCRRPRAPALTRRLSAAALSLSTVAVLAAADAAHLDVSRREPGTGEAVRVAPIDPALRTRAEDAAQSLWISRIAAAAAASALRIDPARLAMWERLAYCETGGNWRDGGQYGGGLGIYVGTWKMYGGREFAPRPQDATKDQQIAVAERIARDGMGGWGCAARLNLTRAGPRYEPGNSSATISARAASPGSPANTETRTPCTSCTDAASAASRA